MITTVWIVFLILGKQGIFLQAESLAPLMFTNQGLGSQGLDSKEKAQPVPFFFYTGPSVESVYVAGDFNRWGTEDYPLKLERPGVWVTTVLLEPGTYQYKFIINNSIWNLDPLDRLVVSDGFGGYNSQITVGTSFHIRWGFFEDYLDLGFLGKKDLSGNIQKKAVDRWQVSLSSTLLEKRFQPSELIFERGARQSTWYLDHRVPPDYYSYLIHITRHDGYAFNVLDPSNPRIALIDGHDHNILPVPLTAAYLRKGQWSDLSNQEIEFIGGDIELSKDGLSLDFSEIKKSSLRIKKPISMDNIDIVHVNWRFYGNINVKHLKNLRLRIGGFHKSKESIVWWASDIIPLGSWRENNDHWWVFRVDDIFQTAYNGIVIDFYDLNGDEIHPTHIDIIDFKMMDFDQDRDITYAPLHQMPLNVAWRGNARHVALVGDFNNWDKTITPLRRYKTKNNEYLYQATIYPNKRWLRYRIIADGKPVDDILNTWKIPYLNKDIDGIKEANIRFIDAKNDDNDEKNTKYSNLFIDSNLKDIKTFPFTAFFFDGEEVYLNGDFSASVFDEINIKELSFGLSFWSNISIQHQQMIKSWVNSILYYDDRKNNKSLCIKCESETVKYIDNYQIPEKDFWRERLNMVDRFLKKHEGSEKVDIFLKSIYIPFHYSGHRIADALFRAFVMIKSAINNIVTVRFDSFMSGQWSIMSSGALFRHPAFALHAHLSKIRKAKILTFNNKLVIGLDVTDYEDGEDIRIIFNFDPSQHHDFQHRARIVERRWGSSLEGTHWLHDTSRVSMKKTKIPPLSWVILR